MATPAFRAGRGLSAGVDASGKPTQFTASGPFAPPLAICQQYDRQLPAKQDRLFCTGFGRSWFAGQLAELDKVGRRRKRRPASPKPPGVFGCFLIVTRVRPDAASPRLKTAPRTAAGRRRRYEIRNPSPPFGSPRRKPRDSRCRVTQRWTCRLSGRCRSRLSADGGQSAGCTMRAWGKTGDSVQSGHVVRSSFV